jgi:predicted TIM-barrel fold metal-dependent hydrolase
MRAKLIDTNVNLSRWPFRRLHGDDTAELVAKLRHHHVTQAWAGSFDGLFHKDIAGVNTRLADECHKHGHGILLPFGSVNLNLPDWEDDLRRCADEHKMPGIRLHPNYHGYKLGDPDFARLLTLATERNLIVQLTASMEDERTQPALMQVAAVDLTPLPELLKTHPKLRLVLLNSHRGMKADVLQHLAKNENVYFEIATLEAVGGISTLLGKLPLSQILLGSHAPLFYLEAALFKLKESPLSELQLKAISADNACRLLARV